MTPLSEHEEDDVALDSIGHLMPGRRECPCGCGEPLPTYNGRRRLVCYATWGKADAGDRMALMLPGISIEGRRVAARRVIELAHRIREARMDQHKDAKAAEAEAVIVMHGANGSRLEFKPTPPATGHISSGVILF